MVIPDATVILAGKPDLLRSRVGARPPVAELPDNSPFASYCKLNCVPSAKVVCSGVPVTVLVIVVRWPRVSTMADVPPAVSYSFTVEWPSASTVEVNNPPSV